MPASRFFSRTLSRLVLLCLIASLTACGFHLRGPRPLAFKTIYLEMNPYSELAKDLTRQIRTSGTTSTTERREDADARLIVLLDNRERNILSLSAGGTVREYQLRHQFRFRVQDRNGRELLSLAEISITRDITYNDNIALAKEQEEAILYRDMQNDLVQQIMRRLAAIRQP